MLQQIKATAFLFYQIGRYNIKIIFANKFAFFLLAATAIFLLIAVINFVNQEADLNEETIFYILLVPGLLLIFYPTVFGIQNDLDSRMLEILFGIPNYRFKVWLVRLALIYIVVFAVLFAFGFVCAFALTPFPIVSMIFQLMFPVFFIGSLSFMFSTLIRNGYGTAVMMVIIGFIFWIMSANLLESKWNIFLNPFRIPERVNDTIWNDIIFKNRIYLICATILSVLYGLLNLQKREKFLG